MEKKELEFLKEKAKEIRRLTVDEIAHLGVGHIGGCLSVVDVLSVLYFKQMKIDPKNPKKEGRDRFIMSKGHAGPALYATLALKGFFDKSELHTLNQSNTNLPSHCDMNKTPGVDMTAGSLGQGISAAVGIALASKIKNENATIFSVIGDGESNEGQVWESLMSAANFNLDNLVVFCDNNKMQIDGTTDEVMKLLDLESKFKSFGFNVSKIDGHDLEKISEEIDKSKDKNGKPTMIILETIKGKGISFIEEMGYGNHSCNISKEQCDAAMAELL